MDSTYETFFFSKKKLNVTYFKEWTFFLIIVSGYEQVGECCWLYFVFGDLLYTFLTPIVASSFFRNSQDSVVVLVAAAANSRVFSVEPS